MAARGIRIYATDEEARAIRLAVRDARFADALREDVVDRWAEAVSNDLNLRLGEGGRNARVSVREELYNAIERLAARAALKYGGRRTYKLVLLAVASELGYYSPVRSRPAMLWVRLTDDDARLLSLLSPRLRSQLLAEGAARVREVKCDVDALGLREHKVLVTEEARGLLRRRAAELNTTVACLIHTVLAQLQL